MAIKEKASKNTIALRLICQEADKNDYGSLDAVAEKIAELVVEKISGFVLTRDAGDTATKVPDNDSNQEP